MSRISEHVPGGVLKAITEEHEYLDQFVDLLRRRTELDRKYVNDLQHLNQSVNSNWSQSPIWPLVGPLIDYFTSEAIERQETCQLLESCINKLPVVEPPDKLGANVSMNDRYQELGKAFRVYEARRVDAHTSWNLEKRTISREYPGSKKYLNELNKGNIGHFSLFRADREHRQAVLYQQGLSMEVSAWHKDTLPERVEAHQQRSEKIKGTIQAIVNQYSKLYTKLVARIEYTKDELQHFSSPAFVARVHEFRELEAGHIYMQPVTYTNIETGEKNSTIIFGTERERKVWRKAADTLLERKGLSYTIGLVPSMTLVHELEQRFQVDVPLEETVETFRDEELGTLLCFILLTGPPIIPLEDDEIDRLSRGTVSRDRVRAIMYRVSQESREIASRLLSLLRGNGYGGAAFVLLTRRPYDSVKGIMFEILRKWDFENDEPLPKGVGRQYDEGRSWLFQQRTGESFDTPPRRTSRIGTSTSSMLQFITSNPS